MFPSIVALAVEACGDSTGVVPVFGVLPVVIASGAFVQTAVITVEFPQLPFFDKVVHFPVAVLRPIVVRPFVGPQCSPCCCLQWSTSPVMQAVQFPRWFAIFRHADDMPVVGNNRCLELDSVVLQRFRSCSSWWSLTSPSLQVQVPMVLTVQMYYVADVLVMLFG